MNRENQIHQIMDWVLAIADIARRHGLNDFPEEAGASSPTASAHLCGLTVFYRGRNVMRIKTHDMDVRMCHEKPAPSTGTSDISLIHSQTQHADFHSGSPAHLATWHARLLQLSSFFAGPQQVASTLETVARAA